MPEIFILSGDNKGQSYQIVFHIPVPNITNKANQNYRTLISNHEDTQSIIPNLAVAIQTKLTDGELYEYSYSFNRNPVLSETAKELKDKYNELKPKILTALQNKYKFYGVTLTI